MIEGFYGSCCRGPLVPIDRLRDIWRNPKNPPLLQKRRIKAHTHFKSGLSIARQRCALKHHSCSCDVTLHKQFPSEADESGYLICVDRRSRDEFSLWLGLRSGENLLI